MANALQFIESNIEDLDKAEVKAEMEKKFEQFVNSDSIALSYPAFKQLQKMYSEEQAFNINEL